ncbi:MAG: dethiobiotin synthase [Blastocatellia bacterium]|nr:MAG: dethiobiotin synthase [Blastocatellia bacterium]
MARGLFVTGTDTGVGKTIVSAALMQRFRRDVPLRYWKPIQTGVEQDDDTAEVQRLGACVATEILSAGIRLPRPLSPHLAADLAGTTIALEPLLAPFLNTGAATGWIVEGAGGALVPINDSEMMIDLMGLLCLPVVITARTTLGTINHTLLTLEAVRQRGLRVGGVVMVGNRDSGNRRAIERFGQVEVLGEMPFFNPLTPTALASWAVAEFDREQRLLEWLR